MHVFSAGSGGMTAKLDPMALSLDDAAQLLAAVGGKEITREMIEADVKAGAPANSDGTINLVHYAAWLVKEMAHGN